MKPAALAVSLLVLLAFLVLASFPGYGLLQPRGGIVTLGISLVLANAAIHAAGNPQRPVDTRFQFAVAGWIWLLVQLGGIVWLCVHAAAQ